jgi:hypothetical protein
VEFILDTDGTRYNDKRKNKIYITILGHLDISAFALKTEENTVFGI